MQLLGPDKRAAIEAAVSQQNVFNWPAAGHKAVNKFHIKVFVACAFATLFLTGCANFNGPHMDKPNTLNICYITTVTGFKEIPDFFP